MRTVFLDLSRYTILLLFGLLDSIFEKGLSLTATMMLLLFSSYSIRRLGLLMLSMGDPWIPVTDLCLGVVTAGDVIRGLSLLLALFLPFGNSISIRSLMVVVLPSMLPFILLATTAPFDVWDEDGTDDVGVPLDDTDPWCLDPILQSFHFPAILPSTIDMDSTTGVGVKTSADTALVNVPSFFSLGDDVPMILLVTSTAPDDDGLLVPGLDLVTAGDTKLFTGDLAVVNAPADVVPV